MDIKFARDPVIFGGDTTKGRGGQNESDCTLQKHDCALHAQPTYFTIPTDTVFLPDVSTFLSTYGGLTSSSERLWQVGHEAGDFSSFSAGSPDSQSA